MGKFKEYLQENEELYNKIIQELDELSVEELDEFALYLIDTFYEIEGEADDEMFSKEEVIEMIKELGEENYEAVLDELEDVLDDEVSESIEKLLEHSYLTPEQTKELKSIIVSLVEKSASEDDVENAIKTFMEDVEDSNEISEGVSRIMKTSNQNRKKRKFMQRSKADLRKTAAQRKRKARETKSKRKRYYKANKNKIAAYQKSRRDKIKKGSHKVKVRRKA